MATQFKEGSKAAKLSKAVADKKPITPRPKKTKESTGATRAPAIVRVRATGEGTSKLQVGSQRAAILSHIPKAARGISVEKLNEITGVQTRGFLQKLIEKGHVENLTPVEGE